MTRIAFSGDQHIGATHLTTLDEQRSALLELADQTIRRACRALVLCGDATHTLRPSPDVLSVWGEALEKLARASVRVVAIAGNHEGQAVTSLLSHFRGSIDAVSEPTIVPDLYGVDLACLPWLPDAYVRARAAGTMTREDVARELTRAAVTMLRGFTAQRGLRPLLLATHATIAGATTGTGFNMGYVPGGAGYILPVEDLVGFDAVFAGHIHVEKTALEFRGWPVYTGSLLPLDFSEDGTHGFIVYDSETGRSERVAVHTPPVKTFDVVDEGPLGIESFVAHHYGLRGAPEIERHGWLGMKARVRVRCSEEHARQFPPRRIEEVLQTLGVSKVQVELTVDRPDRPVNAAAPEIGPLAALGRLIEETRPALADAMRERAAAQIATLEQVGEIGGGDLELVALHAEDFLGVRRADLRFGDDVYSLTGPVGSGKSTVGVDVMRYALFGASRIGGKMADKLVRGGADVGVAGVELRRADGRSFRIMRTVKRTARGAAATLDVLTGDGEWHAAADGIGERAWRPISTGKIADGERVVRDILGGLDDETLCAANLVVQRGADSFTRARAEDRKRLLAQAAGLQVFDRLADVSREAGRVAAGKLGIAQARAVPLRARVATLARTRSEQARLTIDSQAAERGVADLLGRYEASERHLQTEQDRARSWDVLAARLAAMQRVIAAVDGELAEWRRRQTAAEGELAERAEIEAAKAALATVRAEVIHLEAVQVAESEARDRHALASRAEFEARQHAEQRRRDRLAERSRTATAWDAATKQHERLTASECPVVDRIPGEFAPCRFLRDAVVDSAQLVVLTADLERLGEPTKEEIDAFAAADAITLPQVPDTYSTNLRLAGARARLRTAEKLAERSENIARAEEVVRMARAALTRGERDRDQAITERRAIETEMQKLGAKPDVTGAYTAKIVCGGTLEQARRDLATIRERLAEISGILRALDDDAAELARVDAEIEAGAKDATAYSALVVAWKACRVQVLETAVIPAVEEVANDVLRRFPYGIQIALATQREARSGENVETLDVEVLGGRGDLYELCSGGERTTIDTALHLGVALVVARRASTRLRFVVIDEPEGLDEPGRFAFAAIVRWLHDEHGLTVLAMSHMADLVDALGGQRLVAEQHVDGALVGAA